MQSIAFHCTVFLVFFFLREAGDTLETEREMEGAREQEEEGKGAPVISQITSLDALTCLETRSYYFKF